jgi:uncharacterized repeat protein (TIGR01451 family)
MKNIKTYLNKFLRKNTVPRLLCGLTLGAMGSTIFCALVLAEGSYQFGSSPGTNNSNQALFEYDAEYTGGGAATGIGDKNRPIYVDIKNAGEVINVAVCGEEWVDDWSVDLYYVGPNADPSDPNFNYNGTYASYPPASDTFVASSGTKGNGSFGNGSNATNNSGCDQYGQLTSLNSTVASFPTNVRGPGLYELRLNNLSKNGNQGADNTTIFKQFDITVTNPTNPIIGKIPATYNSSAIQINQGRVWSYVWTFNGNGFGNYTNHDFYVIVLGGTAGTNFVWQLDLNYFAGYIYEMVANNRGVDSPNGTGVNVRGLSVPISGNSVSPQYRQYISYPDYRLVRPTQAPQVTNLRFEDNLGEDNTFTPGVTGGIQDTGYFRFTSSMPGTYEIIIDTNKDGTYGAGDVQLRGDTDASGNVSALWNGKDNTGATLPQGTYNAQVKAIVGEYHFIAGDVETSGGSRDGLTINEALSSSSTQQTNVYWDDKTILGSSGTTTLPFGVPGGRHTWGRTSTGGGQGSNDNSWGDLRYIDTSVYGSFTIGIIPAIIAEGDDNDFGDAPDSHGTDKTDSSGEGVGASQIIDPDPNPRIYLGTTTGGPPDKESDGQPSVNADGDDLNGTKPDDEDGVTSFPTLATNATSYSVTVNVQNTTGANAYLAGWIDFNRDGKFQASEGALATVANNATTATLTWNALGGLVAGDTYARLRINNDTLTTSNFIGGGRLGEVEDYKLTINSAVASNPNVLLVKRITSINGTKDLRPNGQDMTIYHNQDPTYPTGDYIFDDNDNANNYIEVDHDNDPNTPKIEIYGTDKWPTPSNLPTPSNFLIGAIDGGEVEPGDVVEYTIYFLSAGTAEAKNTLLRDRLPSGTQFYNDDQNGYATGKGILLNYNGTETKLTNIGGDDQGRYFPPTLEPSTVYNGINCDGPNTNGAIVVDLGNLPPATVNSEGKNNEPRSYGYVRFRAKFKE